jgi:hypothetical protein
MSQLDATISAPFSPIALAAGEKRLLQFIDQQIEDIDLNSEIAPGYWALFAHESADEESNVLCNALLEKAPFPFQVGPCGDDVWQIYYIATPAKATAHHWLDDVRNILSGKIRKPSPIQRDALERLLESPMAHRIARQITTEFEAGTFPLGGIHDPSLVRALLDRIHVREPLFLAALQTLMDSHLIDYVVLDQQLISEDIQVCNDLTQGSVSQDPFFKSRQESVSAIREHLIQGKIINPFDQQKHSGGRNPYAMMVDLRGQDECVLLRIDGIEYEIPRDGFITAIRDMRARFYLGEVVSEMGTNSPWVTAANAYPLRFVQQRLIARPETSALLWLYMLERAAAR